MIDAKTVFGCFHCIGINDATQRLVWKKGGAPILQYFHKIVTLSL